MRCDVESRRFMVLLVLLACLVVTMAIAFVGPTLAADWPAWRGPNRDNISTETGCPNR